MTGLSATTGRRIDAFAHLRQSIRDILTTPIGSRVMRRDYGSKLFSLIDGNVNEAYLVQIYAATAAALLRWEPRLRVTRVTAEIVQSDMTQGKISISLEGEYLVPGPNGAAAKPITMEGILL
jgi:uncharacterized protein